MLDTVKVKSPELPGEVLDLVSEHLQTRTCVDNASGEVLTEFTSGMLAGSFDHRTRVEVCRQELKSVPGHKTRTGRPEFFLAPCSHLIIEGSVHKAMCGQNISNGPEDVRAAVRWYTARIGAAMGLSLPDGDEWKAMRLDWAECFDLGSFDACAEFLSTLKLSGFPRRKMSSYGGETVSFHGTTTDWKIYHKGPEFAVHDRKRLRKILLQDEMDLLQAHADGILRVETGIKLKKLQADFDGDTSVKRLTEGYAAAVYDRETLRVIKESERDMETVRRNRDVRVRLFSMHGDRLGGVLYGTWLSLCACGEEEVRKTLTRRTFYRQRKYLLESGVSWFGSDVQVVDSAIPEGFSLRRSDPRRITGESDIVRRALMPWRTKAA